MRAGYLIIAVAGQGARSSQPRERWLLTFLRRQLHVARDGNRQWKKGSGGKRFSLIVYDTSGMPNHQVAANSPLQGGNVVIRHLGQWRRDEGKGTFPTRPDGRGSEDLGNVGPCITSRSRVRP